MVKPLWALTGIALLGTAGAIGAVVVASPGGEEEVVQQVATATATASATSEPSATASVSSPSPSLAPSSTPVRTPGAGETLYRWANLELLIPDGSGIVAGPGAAAVALAGRDFVLGKVEPQDSRVTSTLVLDGDSGAIIEEHVRDQHRAELDRVLATLKVGPFDRTSAPWPYIGEPPTNSSRENGGGFSYIRPSPATGLYVGGGIGDPGGAFIDIRNERSVAFVQRKPVTGELILYSDMVIAEDKPIFERWLATVELTQP